MPVSAESRDTRLHLLQEWIDRLPGIDAASIEVASADASFRRYFRVRRHDGGTCIVMDAPPGKEDLSTYLKVTGLLESCGVHVPHVLAADLALGCALLEDLGTTHMLTALQRWRRCIAPVR